MAEIFAFDNVQAGLIFLILLVAGDYISKLVKGRIPGLLIGGLIFMALSWAGAVPSDLMSSSGFSGILTISMQLVVVGIGASMNFPMLIGNWRVVVLSMLTYLSQVGIILLIISNIFGLNFALGGIPGGSITALIVQTRAAELGYNETIVLSVLYFSTQGVIASLIAVRHVRKETQRLLSNPLETENVVTYELPKEKYNPFFSKSVYGDLCKAYIVAWVSSKIAIVTGISQFIICLFGGVIAASLGFIDKETLGKSGVSNFFNLVMIANIMVGFTKATPSMLMSMMVPLTIIFVLEIIMVYTIPPLLGKLLGFSKDMSIALGSNIMMGFPLNMMISNDIIDNLTDDPDTRELFRTQISTRMVIAGLSTTTTLAVFMASVLVTLMH